MRVRVGLAFTDHTHLHAVASSDRSAYDMFLLERNEFSAGKRPLPNFIFNFFEQIFGRGFTQELTLVDERDARRGRFHIRNDMGGQDHDSFSR